MSGSEGTEGVEESTAVIDVATGVGKRVAPVPLVVAACMTRIREMAGKTAENFTDDNLRTCTQIERLARMAREAWMLEMGQVGAVDPCSANFGSNSYNQTVMPTLVSGGGMYGGLPMANPASPLMGAAGGAAENFGVTAIRELVEAFSAKKPEELVRAIAAARELGLGDLEVALSKQLGVAIPMATPKPPRWAVAAAIQAEIGAMGACTSCDGPAPSPDEECAEGKAAS